MARKIFDYEAPVVRGKYRTDAIAEMEFTDHLHLLAAMARGMVKDLEERAVEGTWAGEWRADPGEKEMLKGLKLFLKGTHLSRDYYDS